MPPDVIDQGTHTNGTDWRTHMTDDLKADPVVSSWAEKASEKDISSILKGYAHAQKRMGSAINLPGKDAKPEEVQALRGKLYEAGVFKAPPSKAEEYGLADPGNLPDGIKFSPELAGEFSQVLLKHGIPKEAVADLLPIYTKGLQGQVAKVNANEEKIMAELKKEYGDKFDETWEQADRLAAQVFKSPDEIAAFKQAGLGPLLYGPLMRLGKFAAQDSSFVEGANGAFKGEMTGDAAREEYAKVMNDPQHPMYKPFRMRDKKAEEYVDDLYRKAYGTAPVTFGQSPTLG